MIHRALVLSIILLCGCRSTGDEVRDRVLPIVESARPREVAVAYQSLPDGSQAYVGADVVMHAASTMKIAVLIEVLRQAESGRLDLDAGIPLVNRFKSRLDGSEFALDPRDDEDPELYAHLGATVALRELARRMIVRSSNLSTNILIELVTPAAVQATIEELGTTRMKVVRGVEDQKAYDAGMSNVTTARDLMILLRAMEQGQAFERDSSLDLAFEILAAQEFNDMIPAGVPEGTKVLHKTGDITRIRHDAGIVYPRPEGAPYVLVVLTRGFEDPQDATDLVARISREVWEAHTGSSPR